MDKKTAAERIQELTQQIDHYNQAYFQQASSLISDYEFDQLVEELAKLEKQFPELKKNDSPTQRVGEGLSKNFPTVQHQYPMRSLSNSYSIEEVKEFIARAHKLLPNEKITFFCELKIDGIAVSLIYANNQLTKVVTRGDGIQGDDITRNTANISNLLPIIPPLHLPRTFEVRGEVFMKKSDFHALNKVHKKLNKPLLANPRNTVAGTLKTIDPASVADRKLNFYPYALLGEALNIATQQDCMATLKQCGFETLTYTSKHCNSTHEVIEYVRHWEKHKQDLDIAIDGVVIKINDLHHQTRMGYTAKSPRWAIACKYRPESATTILQNVLYRVGRTGVITPVAELIPAQLAGTVVKRASLYNIPTIQRLALHIGDTVTIEKKGDIIPKIIYIDITKRPPQSQLITFSEKCPGCYTPVIKKKALHYCPNHHQCPDQLKATLIHFASRHALDIRHLGPKIISLLFEKKLVSKPAQLYALQSKHLEALPGFQHRSVQKLLQNIEQTKKQPFEKVLFALGIPHVGATVANQLATYFQHIDNLIQASHQELITLPEVGPEIAESIINYFKDQINQQHTTQLRTIGLTFEKAKKPASNLSASLNKKTLVVSGTFDTFSREAIRTYIHHHGGRLVSAISRQVNYLVAGHKPGTKKIKEAEKLGVQIINEHLLRQMAG